MTLQSPEFGTVKFVAIGATLVGSIVFTVEVGQTVRKGDELGYFKFGGSTNICLFEPGRVTLDDDLVLMSHKCDTFSSMAIRALSCEVQPASSTASRRIGYATRTFMYIRYVRIMLLGSNQ